MITNYIFKITDPNSMEALNIAYNVKTKSIEIWGLYKSLPNGQVAEKPYMYGSGKIVGNKCELNLERHDRVTKKFVDGYYKTLELKVPLGQATTGAKGSFYQVKAVKPSQAELVFINKAKQSGARVDLREAA